MLDFMITFWGALFVSAGFYILATRIYDNKNRKLLKPYEDEITKNEVMLKVNEKNLDEENIKLIHEKNTELYRELDDIKFIQEKKTRRYEVLCKFLTAVIFIITWVVVVIITDHLH